MKIITDNGDILSNLCAHHAKHGMYVSFSEHYAPDEVADVAAWFLDLERNDKSEVMFARSAYMLFDSEAELLVAYEKTVGDDGPTKLNPYSGPCKVYALTCDAKGVLQTENT